jgi:hypothetical protein
MKNSLCNSSIATTTKACMKQAKDAFNGACRIATKGQVRLVFNIIATFSLLEHVQRTYGKNNEVDKLFIRAFSLRT